MLALLAAVASLTIPEAKTVLRAALELLTMTMRFVEMVMRVALAEMTTAVAFAKIAMMEAFAVMVGVAPDRTVPPRAAFAWVRK